MEGYAYLALSVLLSAIGQTIFKMYFRLGLLKYLVLSVLSFALTPFTTYKAMLTLTLDTVYMSTAATIAMVLIISRIVLKEEISTAGVWGSLLIILGIVVYNI